MQLSNTSAYNLRISQSQLFEPAKHIECRSTKHNCSVCQAQLVCSLIHDSCICELRNLYADPIRSGRSTYCHLKNHKYSFANMQIVRLGIPQAATRRFTNRKSREPLITNMLAEHVWIYISSNRNWHNHELQQAHTPIA